MIMAVVCRGQTKKSRDGDERVLLPDPGESRVATMKMRSGGEASDPPPRLDSLRDAGHKAREGEREERQTHRE